MNFCADGTLENPKCYKTESYDFASEEQIFDILLDVLKSELPAKLEKVNDCDGNPIRIEEKEIDFIPTVTNARFKLLLNPLGDIPNYIDSFYYRTVEYNFEAILTVNNKRLECVTWELLRFKNAVEGLIIGSEFAIDGYNSVEVAPKGFTYFIPDGDGGLFTRQGAYRFTVTVTQYRQTN